MLSVFEISKSFGIETVLDKVTFVVNAGEKIGLVGPNGCGKTTLLRIISGELTPDAGSIKLAPGARLGYLPQGLETNLYQTVEEFLWTANPSLGEARLALEHLQTLLENPGERQLSSLIMAFGEAQTTFEHLGGYSFWAEAEAILKGLGLLGIPIERSLSSLSGGQLTRLLLGRLLLSRPNLLLLDEPTNHLDLDALTWLENYLSTFDGAILAASHDRVFLDNISQQVIAVDPVNHLARTFLGNYSAYRHQIQKEKEAIWARWNDQQIEVNRMKADIHQMKAYASHVEQTTTSRTPGVRRIAKKVAKKALSREKKLDRYLESDERVEKPKKGWQIKLDFNQAQRSGQQVLSLENICFAYPTGLEVVRQANLDIQFGEKVALVGQNGSGKSTMIKLIVGELTPQSGVIHLGSGVRLGYMAQEQETLEENSTPLLEIQQIAGGSETDTRNFLHFFLFEGDAVHTPTTLLSYGERARLLLARMIAAGANFLVLDEPTNHLDIPAREQFEAALESFPGTVLFSTHDRGLIDSVATRIIQL